MFSLRNEVGSVGVIVLLAIMVIMLNTIRTYRVHAPTHGLGCTLQRLVKNPGDTIFAPLRIVITTHGRHALKGGGLHILNLNLVIMYKMVNKMRV